MLPSLASPSPFLTPWIRIWVFESNFTHMQKVKRSSVFQPKRERIKNARGKPLKKSRDWIMEKKERRRKQGKDVRPDSKFTGRKRSGKLF